MISYKLWEYFIFIMRFVSLIEVVILFAFQNLSVIEESRAIEIILLLVWLIDILINFLAQVEHCDTEKTVYLRDTAKIYLRFKFWVDIISIQNYVFRVAVGFSPFLTGEIIHHIVHDKEYLDQD